MKLSRQVIHAYNRHLNHGKHVAGNRSSSRKWGIVLVSECRTNSMQSVFCTTVGYKMPSKKLWMKPNAKRKRDGCKVSWGDSGDVGCLQEGRFCQDKLSLFMGHKCSQQTICFIWRLLDQLDFSPDRQNCGMSYLKRIQREPRMCMFTERRNELVYKGLCSTHLLIWSARYLLKFWNSLTSYMIFVSEPMWLSILHIFIILFLY